MDPMNGTSGRMAPVSQPTEPLEARLGALGAAAPWPPTPDLVPGTLTRLRSGVPAGRPRSAPRVRWALVLALLALLIAAAVAAAALFGLPGLKLGFTEVLPSPVVVEEPAAIRRWLGRPGDLGEAHAALGDDLLLPQALGAPDEVHIGTGAWTDRVALVYHAAPGEAAVAEGIGLIVTQWAGAFDRRMGQKWLEEPSGAELVEVRGVPGYWVSGKPHVIEYLDEQSGVGRMPGRLVGDVLVWQTGSVVYRIESPLGRDATLATVGSTRADIGSAYPGDASARP